MHRIGEERSVGGIMPIHRAISSRIEDPLGYEKQLFSNCINSCELAALGPLIPLRNIISSSTLYIYNHQEQGWLKLAQPLHGITCEECRLY